MDRLIKEALDDRAAQATVPSDAWERQKALLLAAGAAQGTLVHRPWWRRWATVFEVAGVCVLLVGLVAMGISHAPPRQGGGDPPGHIVNPPSVDELNPPSVDDLNPLGIAPTPHVVVAPDLPQLTPPAGSMTQAQIVAAGVAAVNQGAGARGGQLTLISIALVDGRWQLTFRGDGRAYAFYGGPPSSRKGAYSHVAPVEQLTYQISGATGEIYSTGSTGAALESSRPDLEHYRGLIINGGEQTTLRLVKPAGGREGRDLVVRVPGQALSDSGLDLWHLNYGTGRYIDVWGLTIAPGEVLAYRVAMNDRPGEELLDHGLVHGIPLPDGAKATKGIYQNGAGYTLEGYTVASLKAWYLEQMPRYGWEIGKQLTFGSWDAHVIRFVTSGWQDAEVAVFADEKGVQFTLTWRTTIQWNQDQAVATVFREIGEDGAFRQFPRTPGVAPGEINIGGPPPGETIPATFETRVRTEPDGAWEVELVRSWGQGMHTTWGFRVGQEGTVHSGEPSGDQPPAIP